MLFGLLRGGLRFFDLCEKVVGSLSVLRKWGWDLFDFLRVWSWELVGFEERVWELVDFEEKGLELVDRGEGGWELFDGSSLMGAF